MKKIIIALVSIVVVAAVVIGIVFGINHFRNNDKTTENKSDNKSVTQLTETVDKKTENRGFEFLWALSYDDVQQAADKYSNKILNAEEMDESMSTFYVDGAEVDGIPMQIYYHQDIKGSIESTACYIVPFKKDYNGKEDEKIVKKEHSGKEFKKETEKVFKLIEDMFSIEIGDNYDILTDKKKLSNDEDGFKAVYDCKASLTLVIRDSDGWLWSLNSREADGLIYYEFTHSYPGELPEGFDDFAVNIDLLNGAQTE